MNSESPLFPRESSKSSIQSSIQLNVSVSNFIKQTKDVAADHAYLTSFTAIIVTGIALFGTMHFVKNFNKNKPKQKVKLKIVEKKSKGLKVVTKKIKIKTKNGFEEIELEVNVNDKDAIIDNNGVEILPDSTGIYSPEALDIELEYETIEEKPEKKTELQKKDEEPNWKNNYNGLGEEEYYKRKRAEEEKNQQKDQQIPDGMSQEDYAEWKSKGDNWSKEDYLGWKRSQGNQSQQQNNSELTNALNKIKNLNFNNDRACLEDFNIIANTTNDHYYEARALATEYLKIYVYMKRLNDWDSEIRISSFDANNFSLVQERITTVKNELEDDVRNNQNMKYLKEFNKTVGYIYNYFRNGYSWASQNIDDIKAKEQSFYMSLKAPLLTELQKVC